MADYNVQMKQYNGTSFDNILPYASQALTLAGGGGATEIIAQARAGLSQIATGSYVGNGTSGLNNPTVITCGFKPKIVLIYNINDPVGKYGSEPAVYCLGMAGWLENVVHSTFGDRYSMEWTQTNTGLSWYTNRDDVYGPTYQNNLSGREYRWIALG